MLVSEHDTEVRVLSSFCRSQPSHMAFLEPEVVRRTKWIIRFNQSTQTTWTWGRSSFPEEIRMKKKYQNNGD